MKKYLAAVTIIGFLFLSVSAFAQQPPAKPEKQAEPAQGPNTPQDRLKNFLNLTPEQETKIKDMQKARQDEQKVFQEQMKKLRGELIPLLKDAKADQNKINGLVDQIAKLGAERTKKVLANRNPLQKILTQEQLDKLKQAGGPQGLMRRMQGRGMGPMGQGRFMGPGMGRGMRGGTLPGMGQGMGPGRGMGMGPGMGQGMMRPGMGMGRGLMGLQWLRGQAMQGRPWARAIIKRIRRWFGRI
ncbi:MAG: Spy/CpxP family protein refolding chaperone [Candidatus Aminicenantales bacterium]